MPRPAGKNAAFGRPTLAMSDTMGGGTNAKKKGEGIKGVMPSPELHADVLPSHAGEKEDPEKAARREVSLRLLCLLSPPIDSATALRDPPGLALLTSGCVAYSGREDFVFGSPPDW